MVVVEVEMWVRIIPGQEKDIYASSSNCSDISINANERSGIQHCGCSTQPHVDLIRNLVSCNSQSCFCFRIRGLHLLTFWITPYLTKYRAEEQFHVIYGLF